METHHIACYKMRGGAKAHWIAKHPDFPSIVGSGNTADNAIRDFRKQWRSHVSRQELVARAKAWEVKSIGSGKSLSQEQINASYSDR